MTCRIYLKVRENAIFPLQYLHGDHNLCKKVNLNNFDCHSIADKKEIITSSSFVVVATALFLLYHDNYFVITKKHVKQFRFLYRLFLLLFF